MLVAEQAAGIVIVADTELAVDTVLVADTAEGDTAPRFAEHLR